MPKSPNIISTTKGSAFFVDLDQVIQDEARKEKKISIEKPCSGTSLYIPLFDEKYKPRASKKNSVQEKSVSLNRTFTKEDFSKLKELCGYSAKVNTITNEGDSEHILKNSSSNTKKPCLNKDVKSNHCDENFEKCFDPSTNCITPTLSESVPMQVNIKSVDILNQFHTSHQIVKDLFVDHKKAEKLQSVEAILMQEETLHPADGVDEPLSKKSMRLPKLPNWVTACTSMDSSILAPFENPNMNTLYDEKRNTKDVTSVEHVVRIEELFASSDPPKLNYSSSVLPPITRVSSAKVVRSTSCMKNKNAGSTKTNNAATKTKKNKQNVSANKKNKGMKKGKCKTSKKKVMIKENADSDAKLENDTCVVDNSVDLIEFPLSYQTEIMDVEPSRISDPGNEDVAVEHEEQIESDFKDSNICDNFEQSVENEEKADKSVVNSKLAYSNELTKDAIDSHNVLIESLEKSLSIDSVVEESTIESANIKFLQYNNFLSRISEEQTQNDSTIFSTNSQSKFKRDDGRFAVISENDNTFQEMSKLMFLPGIVKDNSTSLEDHSSFGGSMCSDSASDRQYVRSVLGNVSSRSLYSSSSSQVSLMEKDVIEWQKGKLIDRGAFGVVYQGLTNKAQLIAVKEVEIGHSKNTAKNFKKLQDEINILKGLRHRNIIRFFGTSLEENVVHIFMEYIAGGSLSGLISNFGPLKESIFQRYTSQILSAVRYLHSEGVIHRDIKGANILITVNGTIKLIDFGCAKELSLSLGSTVLLKSVKGTPYWMAPEVIQGTGCNHKSDIWSIGCTVMEMATGKPPWSEYPPYAAMYAIAENTNHPPVLEKKYSDDARSFVEACLIREMTERPSAEDLLNHPFVL